MKHYFSLHWEAAKSALYSLISQPLGTLLVLFMLAIAMTLPLVLYLGVQSSAQVLGHLNESAQMTLYMEHSADAADVDLVRQKLAENPQIEEAEFVSKDKGMAQLQQAFAGQDLVSMLDENPLPDAFTITPQSGLSPTEQTALQQSLQTLPMVENVSFDAAWMQTLFQMNQLVHQAFWLLAITLSVAFVLVAHNTIRLQILSRRDEIEITKLLGAPASFIRRPFLYLAVWQSLLSGMLSLALCLWLVVKTRPLVIGTLRPYGIDLNWRFFYAWETILVLVVVCLLGILGAWLASSRHLLSFKAQS